MGTVVFQTQAVMNNPSIWYGDVAYYDQNTIVLWQGYNGRGGIYTGNFSFSASGVNGTLTGYRQATNVKSLNDYVEQFAATDFSLNARTAYVLIQSGNAEAFPSWALSKNDIISGSAYDDYLKGYAGNDQIFGNNGLDTLDGGVGNDTLNGGAGADTLIGGAGNDIYIVDDSSDTVTEGVGAGIDEVRSSLSYTLGDNLENLVLTGSSDLSGTGNSLVNKITGNAGANTLDGGAGADTLIGEAGDDIYIVDNSGDKTTEVAAQGTDTVRSSITWTALAANIENLTLTGTGNINGTGNTLNNIITGNSGNNILNGGAGNDTIDGGDGVDTINGGDGNDTLSANAGGGVINGGVGNDTLYGGTGTDTLDGGAGNDILYNSDSGDILIGGAGNDTYYIDSSPTTLRESANGGIDTIITSISFDFQWLTNHENLTLTGSSPLFGIGNSLANTIIGNDGDNMINGSLGKDTLTGGLGNDTFVFNTTPNAATNLDTITDFNVTDDTIQLENAVFTGLVGTGTLDLTMFRSGAGVTAAGDSSDRIAYNTTTGALYYDADGLGGTAAVQIALIGNKANLTVDDFVII